MNRTGFFSFGHTVTVGEKALVAMLAAGFFGYWAGLSLSTPGVTVGLASAAATVATAPAAARAPDDHAGLVSTVATDSTAGDEPRAPTL